MNRMSSQFIARNHSDVVLERCRNKRDTNKVVAIDSDEGETDYLNANILESSNQAARSDRPNEKPSRGFVINIDDENDSDGCDLNKNADTDAISSYLSEDECVIFMEKGSFPKEDRFFPKGEDSQNIYSFHNVFTSKSSAREIELGKTESLLSDSDNSDCEIIYGYSGNIRKEWEKAALKKRVQDRSQTLAEHVSLSESDCDCRNACNQSEKIMANFNDNKCSSFSHQSYSENYPVYPSQSSGERGWLHEASEMSDSFLGKNAFTNLSFSADAEEPCTERHSPPLFSQDDPVVQPHIGPINGELQPEKNFHSRFEGNMWNKDVHEYHICTESKLQETIMENSSLYAKQSEASYHNFFGSSNNKENFLSKHLNNNKEHPKATHDNTSFQPRHNQNFEKTSLDTSCRCYQTPLEAVGSSPPFEREKSAEEVTEKCLFPFGNIKTPPNVQNYLIGEREKHKESDEYKHAQEEEWLSRRQQLRIQAEEAQRLRRRKKAETMRLLDMEKRKKQRLEEVRESQKKDEETINLKEKFRANVRKELDKMEMIHRDMASLLRALGIAVDGGRSPLAHEVNAAYKKALLRFHPDRVSRADLRQQVESEEKFKLISGLKEKLLP